MKRAERKQVILENLIYLIIWLTVFITPLLDYWSGNNHEQIQWSDVFRVWKMILPFFVLFLVNNYFLVPYLLIRKKYWPYLLLLITAIGLVMMLSPERMSFNPRSERAPFSEHHMERDKMENTPQRVPPQNNGFPNKPPRNETLRNQPPRPPIGEFPEERRPPMFRFPVMMAPVFNFVLLAILVIGINIAIKLLFKSLRDDQKMKELEKHNLQTELEYLKHQINPHFFMNTLNNIHALVDIDTEKAKETVLELSKMMRYILYDAAQASLPLIHEIQFLTNYIELMRIRYTDQLDIHFHVPEEIPTVKIPPLLFISFIENAFKHGVSYQQKSFIHISMEIKEEELHCLIINSSFNDVQGKQQGIGLENVRKRLHLLYGERYTLTIRNEENEYKVLLIIPLGT
ncbi:histidine kinase [Parabacteroides sp. PF5-9]|uniref:sensor histidine kinase n=1 Tax=Parabacteroides sp. PF5-9 TaxID=1742404 RepID=UPI002472E8B2|nr:histidine kinase [Parabacteroides sp. PF5-9]MDH6358343.1 two-component sensor histidine kinase [Parabacteroides sp. PF5-9]